MQHGAWAMQQLPPPAQQSELCDATSEVALAVLISAATAMIMKYFIVPPVETWVDLPPRDVAEPAQIQVSVARGGGTGGLCARSGMNALKSSARRGASPRDNSTEWSGAAITLPQP